MDRLLIVIVLLALLFAPMYALPARQEPAQSVFFSLLFPQLMPDFSIFFGETDPMEIVKAVFL